MNRKPVEKLYMQTVDKDAFGVLCEENIVRHFHDYSDIPYVQIPTSSVSKI